MAINSKLTNSVFLLLKSKLMQTFDGHADELYEMMVDDDY